jgi:hypothetical protein
MFEKVCTDFGAQLVERNGEAEHLHWLIHHPPKHSVSSMVNSLKGVSSRLVRIKRPDLENAIGRMSCGRRLTLPPVAAGHRWPSSSNTLSNKRPRFNPPYIPALKDRGFTARLVRLRELPPGGVLSAPKFLSAVAPGPPPSIRQRSPAQYVHSIAHRGSRSPWSNDH